MKPTELSEQELSALECLATDCTAATLHGPLPLKTSMELATGVLKLIAALRSAREQVWDEAIAIAKAEVGCYCSTSNGSAAKSEIVAALETAKEKAVTSS